MASCGGLTSSEVMCYCPAQRERIEVRCFLFPGQGAQYPGMAKDLWEASDRVKELFARASDITRIDLKRLIFEGSEEELKASDKTQIAVTLTNLSASTVLNEEGLEPDGFAGFSLGEYSALYGAGVIKLADLFPIVKLRGELMERASRRADTEAGRAGMAAVIGLTYDQALAVLDRLGDEEVYLANHTSPVQVVVSGTASGLEKAEAQFEEAGAKRFVRLRVSGPFHSPLISEARDGLRDALAAYAFSDPVKPVYANATGKLVTSGQEAKELCTRQIVSTVRWVVEEQSLLADGFTRLLEVGPGRVLCGLWKAFNQEYQCLPAGKLAEIRALVAQAEE